MTGAEFAGLFGGSLGPEPQAGADLRKECATRSALNRHPLRQALVCPGEAATFLVERP